MTESAVLFEERGGVATLTLTEPDKLNPMSVPVVRSLRDCLERVRRETAVRAVLLTGGGRGFFVGADLADLGQRSQQGERLGKHIGQLLEEGGNRVIAALRELRVPVVCAVNGPAAGGGVGLALAADVDDRRAFHPFLPALRPGARTLNAWWDKSTVGRATRFLGPLAEPYVKSLVRRQHRELLRGSAAAGALVNLFPGDSARTILKVAGPLVISSVMLEITKAGLRRLRNQKVISSS